MALPLSDSFWFRAGHQLMSVIIDHPSKPGNNYFQKI